MSPLLGALVTILKKGSWIAGGLLALFIAIAVYQTRQPDGSFNMQAEDWKFIGLMVAMLLLAVYLVRGFTKELGGSDNGDGP